MEIERNHHTTLSLEKEQPTTFQAQTTEDIPLIDLSNPNEELVAREVVKASEEWGIFQVVNHGIPTELIQRLQKVGKEFFELPETEKAALARPDGDTTDVEGYNSNYANAIRHEWPDHLFQRIWPPSRVNYTFWPKNPPEYREVNEEYARQVKTLSEKIMEWLSKGLGLCPEALKEGLGGETIEYMMRVVYYPPCPDADSVLGAPDHTDVSGITFLIANEVLGLQASKDNNWIDAKVTTPGIIVIIGDQFMRMSNGRYKSVGHRATMHKHKSRISWPVFVEPKLDHIVGTFPELITGDDNTPKFKPYAYKDYKYLKYNNLPL